MRDFAQILIAKNIVREELKLFLELIEFVRQFLLFAESSDEFDMEVSNFGHIPFEILKSHLILKVEKISRMVDVDVTLQNSIQVASAFELMLGVDVVVLDFDEDVADIALTRPDEFEPVAVVDQQIKTHAHSQRIQFDVRQQELLEPFSADLGQRNGRDILHNLVKWKVQTSLHPGIQNLVLLAESE